MAIKLIAILVVAMILGGCESSKYYHYNLVSWTDGHCIGQGVVRAHSVGQAMQQVYGKTGFKARDFEEVK